MQALWRAKTQRSKERKENEIQGILGVFAPLRLCALAFSVALLAVRISWTYMDRPIYLDHNATTPMLPEVIETMRACYAEPYLNPASQHEFGRRARRKLEDARERIAELVGAKTTGRDADQVIFTSGGTESNNLAVRGLVQREARAGARAPSRSDGLTPSVRVISSHLEHPSVTSLANELSRQGTQIDHLPVTSNGLLDVTAIPPLLHPETRLVTAILAHNETGVLQPVAELAAICNAQNIPLHTDATQAIGKLPVDFRALGASTMTFAAHKFHGPLGIGALVVRHGTALAPQLFGGFQQASLRPGTESVALAVGMRTALELWHATQDARREHLTNRRDEFERTILAGWPGAVVIGAAAPRLPNTSNIALVGLDRQALFIALDQAGVACSTGSACASGSSEPSPAHLAMGLDEAVVSSALRFSFGVTTTTAEARESSRRILHVCNDLRQPKPA
jgi:cysteine desulfurase